MCTLLAGNFDAGRRRLGEKLCKEKLKLSQKGLVHAA